MKKTFYFMLLFIFLIGSFLGGIWYNQRETGRENNVERDRQILHYVDPMNPAHTAKEPGIAPCGMPMEPVYADEESFGSDPPGGTYSMSAGSVKITPQKQQIIGVQVSRVKMVSETHEVRTLGRVALDEDRLYPLIAATDGWMENFQGSSTGSLVTKDQALAQIKVYNYDFFSWQQRYLAELSYMGRRRRPVTNFSGARQPLPQQSNIPQPAAPHPESGQPVDKEPGKMQHGAHQTEMPAQKEPAPEETKPFKTRHTIESFKEFFSKKLEREIKVDALDPTLMGEDDILYANKSRLELLYLGAGDPQLEELARTGRYMTAVQLRSPVSGLVISRSVFPEQRVDIGKGVFQSCRSESRLDFSRRIRSRSRIYQTWDESESLAPRTQQDF